MYVNFLDRSTHQSDSSKCSKCHERTFICKSVDMRLDHVPTLSTPEVSASPSASMAQHAVSSMGSSFRS
jgi:hypothetical protein